MRTGQTLMRPNSSGEHKVIKKSRLSSGQVKREEKIVQHNQKHYQKWKKEHEK